MTLPIQTRQWRAESYAIEQDADGDRWIVEQGKRFEVDLSDPTGTEARHQQFAALGRGRQLDEASLVRFASHFGLLGWPVAVQIV